MHLIDMLKLRPVPAAAVFLTITRRCPLFCAHCATRSGPAAEEHAQEIFLRFVDTFTPDARPELVLLMGGEPLIRPELSHELTLRAQAVGSRVCLISGMFFARQASVPPALRPVIAAVDHFVASLDIFHEAQVPRAAVFRVVHELLDRGQDVSFHVVGQGNDDPYLRDVIDAIRRHFEDQVPILVAPLVALGRAGTWLPRMEHPPHPSVPQACGLAAWPTVAFDGTITACSKQEVVDGPAPAHLRLGHAAVDDWATIRQRCLGSPLLRAIRVFGPEYIADRFGSGRQPCDGYCASCAKLAGEADLSQRLEPQMSRQVMQFVEKQIADIQQQKFTYGLEGYEELRWLGYKPGVAV